mmetsp:Transcript_5672/g.18241  ORF Transcript_5672/g.18241 Transcript_5672/m.18241 type:complete len:307 (+) Transcript_5672:144-1064(+)
MSNETPSHLPANKYPQLQTPSMSIMIRDDACSAHPSHSPRRLRKAMYRRWPWSSLMCAMAVMMSCTSHTCVSAPRRRDSAQSTRRLSDRLRNPHDAAESCPGSRRFLARTSTASGSSATARRQRATSWRESKYMLWRQRSTRYEQSWPYERVIFSTARCGDLSPHHFTNSSRVVIARDHWTNFGAGSSTKSTAGLDRTLNPALSVRRKVLPSLSTCPPGGAGLFAPPAEPLPPPKPPGPFGFRTTCSRGETKMLTAPALLGKKPPLASAHACTLRISSGCTAVACTKSWSRSRTGRRSSIVPGMPL